MEVLNKDAVGFLEIWKVLNKEALPPQPPQPTCASLIHPCPQFLEIMDIFLKLQKLLNVCQAWKYICMTLTRLLECLEILDTFLKFQKLQNVCPACKYFCMIFTRLLECLEAQNIFLKLQKLQNVWQACKYFVWFLKDSWSTWRSETFF